MKFLVDKFSMNMFNESDLLFTRHELTEEEFNAIRQEEEVINCIKAKDIADILNIECNPQTIKARVGDILLLAQFSNRVLRFYWIQVCENFHPALRSYSNPVEELV